MLGGRGGCSTPKISVKKHFFLFSGRLYRNRKSHEIWGHLEAIFGVIELIYDSPPSQIRLIIKNESLGFLEHAFGVSNNYFLFLLY